MPNEQVINYNYNKNNQLENIKKGENKDSLEKIIALTYNSDNQVETQSFTKSNVNLSLRYDKVGREESRTYLNSTNDIIFKSELNYDKNSNIIGNEETKKIASQNKTTLKEYLYDEKDQLTSYSKTDDIKTIMQRNIYGYDKAQNRISNLIETNLENSVKEILELNEDNEYNSIKANNKKVNIVYDDNGNIIEYKDKKYTFDFLNRLIALNDSNNNEIARYYYDAQNRRVEKLINNSTITYLYHDNQVVQERVNDITTNTYYYGEYIDDPIAYSFDEKIYYYVKNNSYSVVSIIDENANVVESYSYSPYGKMSIKDQNGRDILQSNINNAITYTGRKIDYESGLFYYRNRMYSAELGRFLSKDPKGYVDGSNLYAYVRNNPVRYLDPMGTIAREKFSDSTGSGYVTYSKSGRTNDYRVDYDNENKSSGYGYSQSVGNFSFDSSNNDEIVVMNNLSSNSSSDNLILAEVLKEQKENTISSKLPEGTVFLASANNMANYFNSQTTASDYGDVYSSIIPPVKGDAEKNFNSIKEKTLLGKAKTIVSNKIGEIKNNFSQELQKAKNGHASANKQMSSLINGMGNIYNGFTNDFSSMMTNAPTYAKAPLYVVGAITAGPLAAASVEATVVNYGYKATTAVASLPVVQQFNKVIPSLTSKYLSNPSTYIRGTNDVINSILPGIPSNSKIGASAFAVYEMYNRDKENISKIYYKNNEKMKRLFNEK